jgi:hypothetical protein
MLTEGFDFAACGFFADGHSIVNFFIRISGTGGTPGTANDLQRGEMKVCSVGSQEMARVFTVCARRKEARLATAADARTKLGRLPLPLCRGKVQNRGKRAVGAADR